MKHLLLSFIILLLTTAIGFADEIRLGLIGLDTSHVIAFTRILNDSSHSNHVPGVRVVAGYKGGSADVNASASRVDRFTNQLKNDFGIEIVETIPDLCEKVDGILLTSLDGRKHLPQAKHVIEAGLPMFIDKPIAASLEDVVAIAQLAKDHNVPWFGGSSLRWWEGVREAADPDNVGTVLGCDTYSPCSYEPHHPDLFWYGVHGVSLLYAAMGTGCQQVTRTSTDELDMVVGRWEGGRIGTFRGIREGKKGYGGTVFGSKKIVSFEGHSYKGLIEEIVTFFKTGKSPMGAQEIIEMYAFMHAADLSKEQGGVPVDVPQFTLE